MRDEIRARAEDAQAIVLDAESVPFVDVTAVTMLGELTEDLARGGVALVVARDMGQLRDVVRHSGETELRLYPTVEAARDAVRHSGHGDDG